ncbi:MAG: translation initiation factor IF-5A [Nanoarchaeota archaeon]|nr:translation initiation factor IF-5A [Nanoarchaeota archaeon]
MEKKYATLNELKVGSFVLIDDVPCKVVSTIHSKPGKHGAPKIRLEAIGLVDGRRRTIVQPADARVEVPIIEKRNAQVISISGNKANVMDLETYETFDIDIPEEFKDKVQEGSVILYWDVGVKLMKGVK